MLMPSEADKLLMIPGPTPVQRAILDALGEPTMSHTSPAIAAIVRYCQGGLKSIAGTTDGSVFVFAGSGTLAQEAALINLVPPGERLLVVSNGFFGDRFVPMATAHGIEADRIAAPWGRSVTPDELDKRLGPGHYCAVTITQVDTSTGVLAPIAELAEVAHSHGAYVVVDAVCALGGIECDMDKHGIDIVLTGAQKALGVPPGLTILVVSERALERRRSLPRVAAYYVDLLNWEASMANPVMYFSTHAVNHFYALRAALDIIEREGLSNRYARHSLLSTAFRAGMMALGFTSLAESRYAAQTLSVLAYPSGIDDESFRGKLSNHGVVAAGCLGEFKGKGLRFGHMGNISEVEIFQTIAAVERSLRDLGAEIEPGSGLRIAQQSLLPSAVLGAV